MPTFTLGGRPVSRVRQGQRQASLEQQTVKIIPSRKAGFGPMSVILDTETTWPGFERPRRQLYYLWSRDTTGVDDGPSTFKHLTLRSTALGWNDRNVAYGPSATFGFDKPGTYWVEVFVTDGINSVVARVKIEVADPATVFAGAKTICVAQDGDFANAPAGAQTVGTVDEAEAAWRKAGRDGRVLLKRGETYSDGAGFKDITRLAFGAWGVGDAPVLTEFQPGGLNAILGLNGEMGQTSISGINIRGGWDPATTTGDHPNAIVVYATGGHVTFHDLDIRGCSYGVNCNRSASAGGGGVNVCLTDMNITDWQSYGWYITYAHRVGVSGVRADQNLDALGNGSNTKGSGQNEHSMGRVAQLDTERAEPAVSIISCIETLALNGWTPASDPQPDDQPSIQRPAHNSSIRWNTDGRNGLRGVFDRIIAEGAHTAINLHCATNRGENGTGIGAYVDVVMDKMLILGSGNTTCLMRIEHAGVTVRNVIGILPPQQCEVRPAYAFLSGSGLPPVDPAFGNEVYSNTFISWTDGTTNHPERLWDPELIGEGYGEQFGFFVAENNAVHGPRWNSPVISDLDLTERLFAPYYKGLRWEGENDGALDPSYATPDHFELDGRQQATVVLPVPVPGGAEYQTAQGLVAYDDAKGRVRSASPSQGAMEPA